MTIVMSRSKNINSKRYALKYADIATQSYHPVKHITTGEGGAILPTVRKLIIKFEV